jgi:hypothetical protein
MKNFGEETCKTAIWKRRWEDNLNRDIREIGYGDGRWVRHV